MQLCVFHILSPRLYFADLLLHPRRTIPTAPKPSDWPEEHCSERTSKLELEIHNAETDKKYHQCGRNCNRPKDPLSLPHCSHIVGVHAQDPRDEGQGKEDDGDGGENVNSFGVTLCVYFDRLFSLSYIIVNPNRSSIWLTS
jgi:hypothetical protein